MEVSYIVLTILINFAIHIRSIVNAIHVSYIVGVSCSSRDQLSAAAQIREQLSEISSRDHESKKAEQRAALSSSKKR